MILTKLLSYYSSATSGWYADLFPIAHHLFLLLAFIEIAWVGIRLALDQESLTETTGKLLLNIMGLSFFYAILLNANTWIPAIIDGFVQAGEKAAHTGTLDPSGVVNQGIATAKNVYATLGWQVLSPPILIIASLAALAILICFAIIAGLMLATLADMYITIGAGVLLLGFSGSRWSRPIAERFLSKVVAVGVHLFMIYLIIGAGQKIFDVWATEVAAAKGTIGMDLYATGIILPIVYAFTAWRIPNKASDMLSGVFSFTVHEGERMAATGIPMMNMGGKAIGGAAQFVGAAAAPAVAAITAAASAGGQAIMSHFGGGQSGGAGNTGSTPSSNSASGQGSPGPGVTAFRNAGSQGSKTPSAAPPPQGTALSTVKNAGLRSQLQKWNQRGQP